MNHPEDVPDRFSDQQYDPPIRPAARQQIPYAPPGSSSSSINPASTVAFMLNMGYPPPPIALEPLRRLLEQLTQGPGQSLNLQQAIYVTDEVSRSPYRIAPVVLFVIQQRLHSSKPDRVALSLELLDMCVKNCGLDFVRHINKELMKSMVSVVKTTSFKERTLTGQMKKLEKYIMGSPSSTGVATDPRVHKLRTQTLTLIQNWADAFMMHADQVQPILETYKSLRRKGISFPPRDTSQKFLVKHAESSPAFSLGAAEISAESSNISSVLNYEAELAAELPSSNNGNVDIPFTDKQFVQLEKLILLLRTSDSEDLVQKALAMCERLRPKLEESLRLLQSRINSSSSRKLKGSDPRVAQLNAILDLDAEVKRRRGTRLLYPNGPVSPNKSSPPISRLVLSPPQISTAPQVDLLADLLESEDSSLPVSLQTDQKSAPWPHSATASALVSAFDQPSTSTASKNSGVSDVFFSGVTDPFSTLTDVTKDQQAISNLPDPLLDLPLQQPQRDSSPPLTRSEGLNEYDATTKTNGTTDTGNILPDSMKSGSEIRNVADTGKLSLMETEKAVNSDTLLATGNAVNNDTLLATGKAVDSGILLATGKAVDSGILLATGKAVESNNSVESGRVSERGKVVGNKGLGSGGVSESKGVTEVVKTPSPAARASVDSCDGFKSLDSASEDCEKSGNGLEAVVEGRSEFVQAGGGDIWSSSSSPEAPGSEWVLPAVDAAAPLFVVPDARLRAATGPLWDE